MLRLQSAAALARANAGTEADPNVAARLRAEGAQLEARADSERNALSADDRFAVDQCRAFETSAVTLQDQLNRSRAQISQANERRNEALAALQSVQQSEELAFLIQVRSPRSRRR